MLFGLPVEVAPLGFLMWIVWCLCFILRGRK